MTVARNAGDVLAQHTTLELECIDRMYLNVYVPLLQSGGAGQGHPHSAAGQGRRTGTPAFSGFLLHRAEDSYIDPARFEPT